MSLLIYFDIILPGCCRQDVIYGLNSSVSRRVESRGKVTAALSGRTWWISAHWSWRCANMPRDILSSQPLQRCDCFAGCLAHKMRHEFNFVEQVGFFLRLTCEFVKYISRLCKSCSNGSQEGPTALVRNITLEPMPEFAWSLVSTPALLNQAHTDIVLSYTDVVSYVSVNGGDRGKFGWGVGSVWSYKTNKCSRALQVTCMYATKNVHQKTNLGFLSQVFEQITLSAGSIDS